MRPRHDQFSRPPSFESADSECSAKSRRWHRLAVPDTFHLLDTSETGLTDEEALRRLSVYGANTIDLKASRTPFRIMLGQFTDFMILVLIAAAILSGIIGDIKDTFVIAAIVLLNGIIGFVQEYRAERALQALQKMAAPSANVIRNSRAKSIAAAEVVPGDILVLEAGGIVPADLRLTESAQLRTDEAALTGESHPIEKTTLPLRDEDLPLGDRSNMAYSGTFVSHGRGRGVVVATGIETEFGRIAAMLQATEAVETPLQRRLAQFGRQLAIIALVVAAFIFVLGVLRGEAMVLMFLTAVSLAVAAIPEALPAVVTISLALGARRMVQKQALVRKLAAVEALGSVTVICSDKTGTLTQNRMSVEQFYCGGSRENGPRSDAAWNQLLLAMALSNDVRGEGTGSPVGDPTEVALFSAALQAGVHKRMMEDRYPRVAELPFDSERKCMTTLHTDPEGGLIAFTKGATESLVTRAVDQITLSGTQAVTPGELFNAAEEMAAIGLRVLAFGMRHWRAQPVELTPDAVEKDLTFIGLVGIGDPIRKEAAEAIEMSRRAGIATTMITGDHPVTAKAVAKELGILDKDDSTWTGRELAKATEDELAQQVDSVRVYARVAPEQKLKIVRALQARGHLVAMTGDGVNDAPALKQAEIGVAMGITGTDVARQASSLILLDDNFATIVGAVREGRKIYDNLRRFVRYAVTTNSSEILLMLIAPLLGLPIPLLPLQILWVNLVTDGLPGLALAAEPEEGNIMDRPPRSPSESIFAAGLGIHVVWVGWLMAGLAVATQFVALKLSSAAWQTMVLSVVTFSQLAHVMAIRSERESLFKQGLLSNKPLLGAVALMVTLQLAVIYAPILNRLFNTQPLRAVELAWTVVCGSIIFLAVEIEKWFRRKRHAT
jgi:P-type Ca2+ transporter type 2C